MLSSQQHRSLLRQFALNKGMLDEFRIRIILLQSKLHKAEDVDSFEREVAHLESEMDIVLLSNNFLFDFLQLEPV